MSSYKKRFHRYHVRYIRIMIFRDKTYIFYRCHKDMVHCGRPLAWYVLRGQMFVAPLRQASPNPEASACENTISCSLRDSSSATSSSEHQGGTYTEPSLLQFFASSFRTYQCFFFVFIQRVHLRIAPQPDSLFELFNVCQVILPLRIQNLYVNEFSEFRMLSESKSRYFSSKTFCMR